MQSDLGADGRARNGGGAGESSDGPAVGEGPVISGLETTPSGLIASSAASGGSTVRPIGKKRKATQAAAEEGQHKVANSVNSVGRAIAMSGRSRARSANMALRLKLIERAGLSESERQAAYRRLLSEAEKESSAGGPGQGGEAGCPPASSDEFTPGPRFTPLFPLPDDGVTDADNKEETESGEELMLIA